MRRVALAAFAIIAIVGCRSALVPSHAFDEEPPPAEPNYAEDAAWAALPEREDDADVVPQGETDLQAEAKVDVFFIHPTTYYSNDTWNQPLDHERANSFTDEKVLRNQASAFNEAGRIYAPRYRQATLGAFIAKDKQDSVAALDLAYRDVTAAFDYYLEHYNDGRPIIIASHSQGTYHAARLLADRFAGKPLADRLVAAYVIGFALPVDHFERTLAPIGPCREETDTGCLITYSTWVEGADVDNLSDAELTIPYGDEREPHAGKQLHCTNPLLWTIESTRAKSADHLGAVRFADDDLSPTPDEHYVESAHCGDGALLVELPDGKYKRLGKNLHVSDYTIFYLDLRKNAVARADAFLADDKK